MKNKIKVLCGLIITVINSSNSQPNWEWISPKPQGNALKQCIVNNSVIIAVGDNSTIIKSTNKGDSWQVSHSVGVDGKKLVDLTFSDSVYYACGEAGKIIKSTNEGKTWERIESPTSLTLYSISFVSPLIGWCGGIKGELFKTTNGGKTWFEQKTGSTQYIQKIRFLDSLNGYVASSLYDSLTVLKTADGGKNWKALILPTKPYLRSIYFCNKDSGWAVGDWGSILRTTDGGLSWDIQRKDSSLGSTFYDVFFTGPDTGWVVGWSSFVILTTVDGGKTWEGSNSSIYPLYSVHGSNTSNLWATGDRGQIYFSSDAGLTWINKQSRISRTYLKDIFFYGNSFGWTFDNDGKLFRTTNGGIDWSNISNSVGGDRLFFANQNLGWMVSGSNILKTSDGGVTWSTEYTTIEHLYDLYFLNDSVGWAVGRYGGVLKTTDAGDNWIIKNSGISYFLSSVFFINKDLGWSASFSGGIIKTTDGGNSWSQQYYNTYFNLRCLFFVDSLNGWAGGQFDALLHTTNGGITWEQQVYDNGYGLTDIKFVDDIGYAVGESPFGNPSIVIRSIDKGLTWQKLDIGAAMTFYGVHFTSPNNGWIVGGTGAILHTTNGSVTSVIRHNAVTTPADVLLYQNYPNPFNPKTTIRFYLPTSTHVRLSTYDLVGRELDVLVDTNLENGFHETTWNAYKYSSGIYFYNIHTEQSNITNKLILIK